MMLKIIDKDNGEIVAKLDGREVRTWIYRNDEEHRVKMLAAREFAEGWFQADKRKET